MTKKAMLCVLLLIAFGTTFCDMILVYGATRRVAGVRPGDFNGYRYNATGTSDDPNSYLPSDPYFLQISSIDSFQAVVQSVIQTNITCQLTYTFKNGSTQTELGWVDVSTGQTSDYETWKLFIAADLLPNDYLYADSTTAFINETIKRTYLGVSRDINHVHVVATNITQETLANGVIVTRVYNGTFDYYWDRLTGSLTEYTENLRNQNGTYNTELTAHVSIQQSNIVPEFSPSSIVLLLIMVTFVAVVASKKRARLTHMDPKHE